MDSERKIMSARVEEAGNSIRLSNPEAAETGPVTLLTNWNAGLEP